MTDPSQMGGVPWYEDVVWAVLDVVLSILEFVWHALRRSSAPYENVCERGVRETRRSVRALRDSVGEGVHRVVVEPAEAVASFFAAVADVVRLTAAALWWIAAGLYRVARAIRLLLGWAVVVLLLGAASGVLGPAALFALSPVCHRLPLDLHYVVADGDVVRLADVPEASVALPGAGGDLLLRVWLSPADVNRAAPPLAAVVDVDNWRGSAVVPQPFSSTLPAFARAVIRLPLTLLAVVSEDEHAVVALKADSAPPEASLARVRLSAPVPTVSSAELLLSCRPGGASLVVTYLEHFSILSMLSALAIFCASFSTYTTIIFLKRLCQR